MVILQTVQKTYPFTFDLKKIDEADSNTKIIISVPIDQFGVRHGAGQSSVAEQFKTFLLNANLGIGF